MTKNSVVRARIDETTKSEATTVLATMGLTLSDAFQLFLKRVVTQQRLPFEALLVPNAKIVAAYSDSQIRSIRARLAESNKELARSGLLKRPRRPTKKLASREL